MSAVWPKSLRYAVASYEEALFRATYYRWVAGKGGALPGGDPVTGRPRSHFSLSDVAESRAAYLAMARHWLAIARERRVTVP